MSELFQPFPKMPRLSRECIITEKIDGTNAQIHIVRAVSGQPIGIDPSLSIARRPSTLTRTGEQELMFACSRRRYIALGDDNFGFAAWVAEHADDLFTLGPGRHYGEWWGKGIQRGYGLSERRFSLFNTTQWAPHGTEPQRILGGDPRIERYQSVLPACCHLVPEISRCTFNEYVVDQALKLLEHAGSIAAPGFMNPEGIVVFHTAAGVGFKKTLKGDEQHKSQIERMAHVQ